MTASILPATPEAIDRAARLIRAGELVAFPTETVYGLGGDAGDDAAVARIFAAKGRPRFNPLIVHVPGLTEAEALAAFDERARLAARRFWPGPLSLVLRRRAECGLSLLASAGLDTVALRAPAHVAAEFGTPFEDPHPPITKAMGPPLSRGAGEGKSEGLGPAMILDAGPCSVGVESTVLDLTGAIPAVLRAGGVTLEELRAVFGQIAVPAAGEDTPRAPGRLPSHYAPGRPVRLDAVDARPGEALLAFGAEAPPGFAEVLFLSRSGDLAEAAANLFAMLRRLDRPEFSGIAVMPIPEVGLGRAINDRLRRAAASKL